MEFRPCIDIHNGKVKQIVGSSLRDAGDQASENFVSGQDAPFYARMYPILWDETCPISTGHSASPKSALIQNGPRGDIYARNLRSGLG